MTSSNYSRYKSNRKLGDRHAKLTHSVAAIWLTVLLGLGAAAAIAPTAARADGDPASDVLATQALFLPWDADVPAVRQEQLSALLAQAEHGGYPIRVALIASRADLGSIGALWQRPQGYAEFLAQELSLLYRGPLLVVMPDGFGLDRAGLSQPTIASALGGIPIPRSGAQLAGDTLTAVRRLAAAAGHPLSVSASAKATAMATTAAASTTGSGGDPLAWIAYAVGAVLIALAWAASLRVQPPHRAS